MSYERYKDFRLAPDDNGCWDVLDKEYQQTQTFPSKAAAKRWIDTQVFDNAQPEYMVQVNPQDIFVEFEIWVKPKDNYRELEKMLGRLLDAWVTDLKPSDPEANSRSSKSQSKATLKKGGNNG